MTNLRSIVAIHSIRTKECYTSQNFESKKGMQVISAYPLQ